MMLEACFGVGLAAGMLSGLFGVGGGVIVVPALCWLLVHFSLVPVSEAMKVAIATSLAIMIMTLLSAVGAHWRQQSVRWDFCRSMLPGIMLGAFLGVWAAHLMPGMLLRIGFGVFMWVTGLRLLLRRGRKTAQSENPASVPQAVLRLVSVVTGALAGVLGVSGGVILGPFFLRSGLSASEAAGTSVVCGLVIGVCATAGFILTGWQTTLMLSSATGYIYWPAFFGVAIASMLAAPVGARLSQVVPRQASRRLFGMLLLGVSLSMFFSVG